MPNEPLPTRHPMISAVISLIILVAAIWRLVVIFNGTDKTQIIALIVWVFILILTTWHFAKLALKRK